MVTRDVLKVLQIVLAYGSCNFENFQNITRAHKSRNARAVHAISYTFNNWTTIRLDFKVEIFKPFYRAYNDILTECLSNSIFRKRESCYALRGQDVILIPRCNSRLMKNSLAYRGTVLWNLVNHNDKITN